MSGKKLDKTDPAALSIRNLDPVIIGRIRTALDRTWNAIGDDCLNCIEYSEGKAVMSRAAVVEVVLDANHAEEYGRDREAVAALRLLSYKEAKKLAKAVFTNAQYGR